MDYKKAKNNLDKLEAQLSELQSQFTNDAFMETADGEAIKKLILRIQAVRAQYDKERLEHTPHPVLIEGAPNLGAPANTNGPGSRNLSKGLENTKSNKEDEPLVEAGDPMTHDAGTRFKNKEKEGDLLVEEGDPITHDAGTRFKNKEKEGDLLVEEGDPITDKVPKKKRANDENASSKRLNNPTPEQQALIDPIYEILNEIPSYYDDDFEQLSLEQLRDILDRLTSVHDTFFEDSKEVHYYTPSHVSLAIDELKEFIIEYQKLFDQKEKESEGTPTTNETVVPEEQSNESDASTDSKSGNKKNDKKRTSNQEGASEKRTLNLTENEKELMAPISEVLNSVPFHSTLEEEDLTLDQLREHLNNLIAVQSAFLAEIDINEYRSVHPIVEAYKLLEIFIASYEAELSKREKEEDDQDVSTDSSTSPEEEDNKEEDASTKSKSKTPKNNKKKKRPNDTGRGAKRISPMTPEQKELVAPIIEVLTDIPLYDYDQDIIQELPVGYLESVVERLLQVRDQFNTEKNEVEYSEHKSYVVEWFTNLEDTIVGYQNHLAEKKAALDSLTSKEKDLIDLISDVLSAGPLYTTLDDGVERPIEELREHLANLVGVHNTVQGDIDPYDSSHPVAKTFDILKKSLEAYQNVLNETETVN